MDGALRHGRCTCFSLNKPSNQGDKGARQIEMHPYSCGFVGLVQIGCSKAITLNDVATMRQRIHVCLIKKASFHYGSWLQPTRYAVLSLRTGCRHRGRRRGRRVHLWRARGEQTRRVRYAGPSRGVPDDCRRHRQGPCHRPNDRPAFA